MKTLPECNLCQQKNAEWYCRKDAIDVVHCRNCGLIFTSEMQQNEKLDRHYSSDYFEPYLKTTAIHLRKRFSKRIAEIKRFVCSGSLLDVGCGTGSFLKLAVDTGYEAQGVERSSYAAQYARNNFGLSVFHGELGDAGFAPSSFDIITLWHILEHVHDPKNLLARVHALLKRDGLLAIEIPNIGSFAARIAGMDWELMAPKEHFYYFNANTINRYLEEAGFTIMRIQTFFWTTPAMILRTKAAARTGFGKSLLRATAGLVSCLSWIRFRVTPPLMSGDVLTIYAMKKGRAL